MLSETKGMHRRVIRCQASYLVFRTSGTPVERKTDTVTVRPGSPFNNLIAAVTDEITASESMMGAKMVADVSIMKFTRYEDLHQ